MVLKNLEHLETFAIKCPSRILEEETSWPILNGRPKLTLPKLAGQGVPSISQEQVVGASRRESRRTEPEHENIARLMVVVGRLDRRQGEALRGDGNGSRGP